MDLQIFIFTWNTQTVRYNIGDGPDADFVHVLGEKIINSERNYDLVVIGLQEDAMRDSPLLSNNSSIIVESLAEKYQLLKLVSLSGWGVTTYKALAEEWDYRPRGLRLGIFKRRDLQMEITNVEAKEMVCPGIRDWITAGKGGVVVNIHTDLGKIAFLNIHLPFSSRSIIQDPIEKISRRHNAVMWQAKCLRSLYEDAVATFNPDYLFVLGDMNFRVQIRTESGATEIADRIVENPEYIKELVQEADELQLLLDYSRYAEHAEQDTETNTPLPILKEGVNNTGPQFLPTCKLQQGRSNISCYRPGNEDQRTPSWCDRILFKQFDEYKGELCCLLYDRWDHGTMNLSDHASVVGVYRITSHKI